MANELVALADFETFLGDNTASEQSVRTGLIAQVKATFERECGRGRIPFQDAQAARVERLSGTGNDTLVLDYPIGSLTSVKLGFDSATPDETLSVADRRVLVFSAGSRVLRRVDGGTFGPFGAPEYAEVTYNAAADLPADAKLAVLRRAAAVYRQRGSEEASSESVGDVSVAFGLHQSAPGQGDTVWHDAVAAHARTAL